MRVEAACSRSRNTSERGRSAIGGDVISRLQSVVRCRAAVWCAVARRRRDDFATDTPATCVPGQIPTEPGWNDVCNPSFSRLIQRLTWIGVQMTTNDDPLGATWSGDGTHFRVFSSVAQRIDLCLFDAQGRE